jgi:peptidyl-prolyl cis-trans isomerase SurA
MRGVKKLGRGLLGLILGLLCATAAAEVVDRSVAVVNGHMVTWSDLDEQMRFEALQNQRPLRELTAGERRSAFDHLVENWILRDQMQGMFPAADEDVEARIAELRSAWHMEKDAARWNSLLQSYGLRAEELHSLAANQLEILRFLEFRVRPLSRVTRQEVEEYYKNTLTPQIEARGQTPEPLRELAPKIRELLVQQKMNQELEKWLANLRSQAQVRVLWSGVQ